MRLPGCGTMRPCRRQPSVRRRQRIEPVVRFGPVGVRAGDLRDRAFPERRSQPAPLRRVPARPDAAGERLRAPVRRQRPRPTAARPLLEAHPGVRVFEDSGPAPTRRGIAPWPRPAGESVAFTDAQSPESGTGWSRSKPRMQEPGFIRARRTGRPGRRPPAAGRRVRIAQDPRSVTGTVPSPPPTATRTAWPCDAS